MVQGAVFYDKGVTCKLCEHEFSTKRIFSSHLRVDRRDSDLCTYYRNGLVPYYYEISVCPACGFAFSDSFASVSPVLRASVKAAYEPYRFAAGGDLSGARSADDAILALELALRSGSCAREDSLYLAGICMRLAWLHRLGNDDERQVAFLAAANRYYLDVYSSGKDDANLPLVLHMLGETSMRTGAHAEARRWFGLLFNKDYADYPYLEIAKDAWADYRRQTDAANR